MQGLSAAQRECLVLRSQGLKYREIADVLNVSTSTVGENIQRGLERLKEVL
jgi:RNA polymerase sigma-70 factor (ECF subfamily)